MNVIVQTTKEIISIIATRVAELKIELQTVKGDVVKEVTVATRIEENQLLQVKLQGLLIEYLKRDIEIKNQSRQN